MKLQTMRLEGAGNSFLITYSDEAATGLLSKISVKDFIQKVCKDSDSDGFITLEPFANVGAPSSPTSAKEFKWYFYNRDGSEAEMCGNAARCVGHYLLNQKKLAKDNLLLHTKAGSILIQSVSSDNFDSGVFMYEVQMPPLKRLQHHEFFYCDSGVPHVVVPISNIARHPIMKNFCQEIREHKDFQPKGTNVTLIDTTNPEKISAVTFERGVEGFTQACGTGAVAAAFYLWEKMGRPKSSIHMPGGRLDIDLENLTQPRMLGPVISTGELTYDI